MAKVNQPFAKFRWGDDEDDDGDDDDDDDDEAIMMVLNQPCLQNMLFLPPLVESFKRPKPNSEIKTTN